ncbi:MAG: pyridoxamine 5'-phosphate oxidase family protein [Desulfomonilia bacterium]
MDFDLREVKVVDPQQLTLQMKALFTGQGLAVVSTQEHGQPYCNLVAFASTDDLKHLIFATNRATRKFANIDENPRVSMLIDNRSNRISDFHEAVAVNAVGLAEEILGPEAVSLIKTGEQVRVDGYLGIVIIGDQ